MCARSALRMIDAGMMDSASIPVVAETVNDAVAGVTWRSSDRTGRRACVQYRALNDANPAPTIAKMTLRYMGDCGVYPSGKP